MTVRSYMCIFRNIQRSR